MANNQNITLTTKNLTTINQLFVTPAQIAQHCKSNKITISPAQVQALVKLAKQVVFYNSASNRYFTGFNATQSNVSHYNNFTTGLLRRCKAPNGKPFYVANKKGMPHAAAQKLGFFKCVGSVACGKFTAAKGSKTNNVVILATNKTALNSALQFATIVSNMPAAHVLPACSTWA